MLSAILLSSAVFHQLTEALNGQNQQSLLHLGTNSSSLLRPKRVAIIGSGIAGAVAAYTLREESWTHQVDIEISVFEAQPRVGGRIGYTDRMEPSPWVLDTGALSFLEQDWCMNEAIRSVGLRTMLSPLHGSLGVWNGNEFIFIQNSGQDRYSWWNLGKMIWWYGMSPWKLQQAMKRDLDRWQRFNSYSTFDSISRELNNSGFTGDILQSADAYLQGLGISEVFSHEIVEPMVRLQSDRTLGEVPVLDMLLAMSGGERQHVREGNSRLIERLLLLSGAIVEKNTAVDNISPGSQRRYKLGVANDGKEDETYTEYDAVIITAPFQSNGITFDGFSIQQRSLRPYVPMHTTNVISTNKFSSKYFNISSSEMVDNILTSSSYNSSIGFHAIQYLGRYGHRLKCGSPRDPDCDLVEFAQHYRISSSKEVPDATIAALTGTSGPNVDDEAVLWTHRESWKYGVPKYGSNYQLFDKVELAPSLFYTSGAEGVVSSLEMACRIARNAAKTLVWLRWSDFVL